MLGIRTAAVQKPARQRLGSETAKETFCKVLEHRGVRFTVGSNPTQCPFHGTRQLSGRGS